MGGTRAQPLGLAAGIEILIGTSEGKLCVFDLQGNEVAAKTIAKRILTDLHDLGAHRVVFGTKGAIVTYRVS